MATSSLSSFVLLVVVVATIRVVMSCALSSDVRDSSVPKELARGNEEENNDGHGDDNDDAFPSFSST
jgi:hypothetical protein